MMGAKRWTALGLALLAGPFAHADDSAERERIRVERAAAQERFEKEERACRGQFAVTACEDSARARRREALADLRRQEVSLNDAQRLEKAAKRSSSQDERASAEHQQASAQARARAVQADADRHDKSREKAAGRAEKAASAPGLAAGKRRDQTEHEAQQARALSAREARAAQARQAQAERRRQALEHDAELRQRQGRRVKPPASSLAVPP